VLLLVAAFCGIYGENLAPMPIVEEGTPGWTASQALLSALVNMLKKSGNDTDAPESWPKWLKSSSMYTDIGMQDIYVPVGPWMPHLDNRCTQIAQLLQRSNVKTFRIFKDLLIKEGYPKSTIDRWVATAEIEMQEMRPKMFGRWRYAWASRTKVRWFAAGE